MTSPPGRFDATNRGELPAAKTGREYLGSMDRVDAIFGPEEESWGCFTARRRASCSKRKTPAPESRDGRSLFDAPLLLWKAERCTHADSARSISMVRHRTALFKPERSPLFFCREDPAIRVCAEHVRCRRFYLSKPRRTASHICFNRVNPAPLTERKRDDPLTAACKRWGNPVRGVCLQARTRSDTNHTDPTTRRPHTWGPCVCDRSGAMPRHSDDAHQGPSDAHRLRCAPAALFLFPLLKLTDSHACNCNATGEALDRRHERRARSRHVKTHRPPFVRRRRAACSEVRTGVAHSAQCRDA